MCNLSIECIVALLLRQPSEETMKGGLGALTCPRTKTSVLVLEHLFYIRGWSRRVTAVIHIPVATS